MQRAEGIVDRVELLRQTPEFVGMVATDGHPVRVVMMAPEVKSGRVFVAVDEAGGLRLVGCPDQRASAEPKHGSGAPGGDADVVLSGMVGELLAVSGRLWNQPASFVAGLYEKEFGIPIAEAVRRRAGADWRADKFMLDLAKSLREGKFPMVLLVDRMDPAIEEAMQYLRGMNLNVQLLGYEYFQSNGVEVVRPVLLAATVSRPTAPSAPEQREPALAKTTKVVPEFSALDVMRQSAAGSPRTYEPLPTQGTSPKQQEILKRLVHLEDLGLVRRGLEFFAPGVEHRPEAEGTIVVAVDKTRWPFVSEEEVIVVVRTTREHFAGFLGMKQQEVEDFLNSLPREQRKERKGALLLRASNPYEASQLVNELKALKEIAVTTRSG